MLPSRKKLKSYSLHDKLKALDEINRGVAKSDIARRLGVHITTVKKWGKTENKLRKWQKSHEDSSLKGKKRIKPPANPAVDEATWIWFQQHHSADFPVNWSFLKVQALRFCQLFGGGQEFKASSGWLDKWKLRHGIKNTKISGEKSSSDQEAVEEFKTEFMRIITTENLTPDQVFNCGDTGLNFRQVPRTSSIVANVADPTALKIQKERITVLACANAAGTLKLPLVVVGKYAKPRAIKDLKTLPVVYRNQKNAWMNGVLFEEWFKEEFVPEVQQFLKAKELPLKAILFMDNCSAHPSGLSVGEIRVEFLPPNTTPLIRPMDQGCLQNIKTLYRLHLMSFMLEQFNSGDDILGASKNVTIREVIYWLAHAWTVIAPSTVRKSWKPLWPELPELDSCDTTDSNESMDRENLINKFHENLQIHEGYEDLDVSDIHDWVNCHVLLNENERLEDEEIVEIVREYFSRCAEIPDNSDNSRILKRNNSDTVEVQNNHDETRNRIQKYLGEIIKYCEGNPYYTNLHLLGLHQLHQAVKSEGQMPKS